MAELKNAFTGGKMDKDTDERIVQNGVYRSALNVSVSTSEDSDVGAAQNILGNTRVTDLALHRTRNELSETVEPWGVGGGGEFEGSNFHIASITDPQTNKLYRFIHTDSSNTTEGLWMDRIIEFDPNAANEGKEVEASVFVDIFKVEQEVEILTSTCTQGVSNMVVLKTITPHKNLYQIRWGMKLMLPTTPIPGSPIVKAVVDFVDYNSNLIYVRKLPSEPYYGLAVASQTSVSITFYSDRNLNFGTYDPSSIDGNYGLKKITGINIIDGMIFWTDNFSEPKKINIERSKIGSNFEQWANSVYGRTNTKYIDNFTHHTLLINSDKITVEGHHIVDTCDAALDGCTDPTAANYNPLATNDDGSCIPAVPGCFDPLATNYNCLPGNTPLPGSTDCGDGVNINDGSCIYAMDLGCTDPAFCNYDPLAIIDDGSCAGLPGCTDPLAFNYDPTAGCPDGSCIAVINGCTDPLSSNYNPLANVDDGTCLGYNYGCMDDGNCLVATCGYDSFFPSGCIPGTDCVAADNYNAGANNDDGSCTYSTTPVYGCIDPAACNYDPTANSPCDGVNGDPCVTGQTIGTHPLGCCCDTKWGCTDPLAYDYGAAFNCDDGSCSYCAGVGGEPPIVGSVGLNAGTSSTHINASIISGGFSPFYYHWYETSSPSTIISTAQNLDISWGVANVTGNYAVKVTYDQPNGPCEWTSPTIIVVFGCTDATATNYDVLANVDDGSCVPHIYGCTDPTATNYVPLTGNPLIDINTPCDGTYVSCVADDNGIMQTGPDCCCVRPQAPLGPIHIPDINFRKALIDKGLVLVENFVDLSGNFSNSVTQIALYEYVDVQYIDTLTVVNINCQNASSGMNCMNSLAYDRIVDLTGIEYFTSMTELQVWEHRVAGSLDLTNSPALLILNARNCELTALDVNGLSALYWIELYGNPLVDLDFSSQTESNLTLQLDNMKHLTSLNTANGVWNSTWPTNNGGSWGMIGNRSLYCVDVDAGTGAAGWANGLSLVNASWLSIGWNGNGHYKTGYTFSEDCSAEVIACGDPNADNYNSNFTINTIQDLCDGCAFPNYQEGNHPDRCQYLGSYTPIVINGVDHIHVPDPHLRRWITEQTGYHNNTITPIPTVGNAVHYDWVDAGGNGMNYGYYNGKFCPHGEYIAFSKIHNPFGSNNLIQMTSQGSANLTDATGIAALHALKNLKIYAHMQSYAFTKLDLSNNTQINQLDIGRNYYLTHVNFANGNNANFIGPLNCDCGGSNQYCATTIEVCVDDKADSAANWGIPSGHPITFIDVANDGASGNACDPATY